MNLIIESFTNWFAQPNLLTTIFLDGLIFVILSIVHLELLTNMYNINFKKNQKVSFIIFFSLFNLINKIFFLDFLYKLISLCLLPMCIYWLLDVSYKKCMVFTCIIEMIKFIVQIIITIALLVGDYNFQTNIISTLIVCFLGIFECVLGYMLKKKSIHLEEKFEKKKGLTNQIYIFLFLLFLLLKNYKYYILMGESSNYLIIDLVTLMFLTNCIIIKFDINIQSNIEVQKKEMLKKYSRINSLSTKNIKKIKNEFATTISEIGFYIQNNDYESLKKLYDDIMQEYKDINQIALLDPKVINESAIYSILCSKYYLAKMSGINIELEIMLDFSKINIKTYELVKILGILLDNAIEGTKECDKKYIYLSFCGGKKKDIIKIYNTYNNLRDCDVNKIFVKGYSTKNKNTGLGLWEIKQILLKYSNLELYTHKDEKNFYQEFSIYHN